MMTSPLSVEVNTSGEKKRSNAARLDSAGTGFVYTVGSLKASVFECLLMWWVGISSLAESLPGQIFMGLREASLKGKPVVND